MAGSGRCSEQVPAHLAPLGQTRLLVEATGGLFGFHRDRPRVEPAVPGRATVICPTTDERALFHAQLYSCFVAQRWPDKELVVIDTGAHPSPFLSLRALEDERLVYRHFRVMATEWSVGLKRNLAVHLASGAIIAHFDDDDLYAPCYLDQMIGAMAGADAVTLSSWFVCDPLAGLVGAVSPEVDGSQEGWVLGYGFSHCYTRQACLTRPFPHEHFAEDYRFMLGLRDAPTGRGVHTRRDDEGIVLHMQHGTNLSNSHARWEVPLQRVRAMPVAQLPGFDALVAELLAHAGPAASSSFVSFGEAFRMCLRRPPHRGPEEMARALRAAGAAVRTCMPAAGAAWAGLDLDVATALVSCRAKRRGELFVEPGRAFTEVVRFRAEVKLPADVARTTEPERLALLHVARMLLRRCPAQGSPDKHCEGRVRLQLRALSHVALVSMAAHFVRHFPGVRLEVEFEPAEVLDDFSTPEQELMRCAWHMASRTTLCSGGMKHRV